MEGGVVQGEGQGVNATLMEDLDSCFSGTGALLLH